MECAVIKTGGKQYVVSKGDTISIEKMSDLHKEGDSVVFEEVLLMDDGSNATIGTPSIKDAKVSATIVSIGRAKKIDVVKYKAKSRYIKRRGHRQPFVSVHIDSIS